MFKTYISVAIAAAVTLSAGSALAASNTAFLTIDQSGSSSLTEDVSGLLVASGNNNFTMLQGSYVGQYFQNGQLVASASSSHPDYWQWDGSSWNWSSTQTATELSLKNISGHGDPDLSFDIFAKNKNASAQTYSFTTVENVVPVVSSANLVHADLTTTMANLSPNTVTQKFELSSDGGVSFTNAGVDITAANAGTFTADASGPIATSWNSMRIVTTFKLAANTTTLTEFSGFASITPVPEPESYAMMLSGLVLLASMAYRRNL